MEEFNKKLRELTDINEIIDRMEDSAKCGLACNSKDHNIAYKWGKIIRGELQIKKLLEERFLLIFALLTEKSGEVYEDTDQAFSVIKQKLSAENYNDCPYCGELGNKAGEQ